MRRYRELGLGALIAALALLAANGLRSGGAAPIPLAPDPAFASSQPGTLTPFLRFTGTGTVSVRPDTATIWFSTQGRALTLSAAENQASAAMSKVIAALKAHGEADADLRTEGGWTYDSTPDGGLRTAMQSLTVTVRDLTAAGKLMAVGIDAGASDAPGPSFSLADQHAGYASALRAAITDARSKADSAAQMLGVKVTGVVSVDESSQTQPIMFGAMADAARPATSPVPVKPGMQQVSASVTVTFSYS
ncbi:MAG: SIMPL domain-containing protein [Gaiellales bacterium]